MIVRDVDHPPDRAVIVKSHTGIRQLDLDRYIAIRIDIYGSRPTYQCVDCQKTFAFVYVDVTIPFDFPENRRDRCVVCRFHVRERTGDFGSVCEKENRDLGIAPQGEGVFRIFGLKSGADGDNTVKEIRPALGQMCHDRASHRLTFEYY